MIFQDCIGVDIRDNRVILAYLKQSFRGVLLAAHSVRALDPGISHKEKMEDVRSIIQEFRDEHQIATRDLVIGIPNDSVIFREVEYPTAIKENLRSTLEYDMDKYIPIAVDDVCFDFQVIEEDRKKDRLSILLALIKKADCKPYLSLCKQWPGGVYGLGISSLAEVNGRAFLSGNKSRAVAGHIRELLKGEKDPIHGDVSRSIDLSQAGIPSLDLIPAFGLALTFLWKAPIRINLLPPEIRKRPNRVGYFTLIGLASLVILLGIAWAGGYLFRQQLKLSSVEKEISQLSSEVRSITEMRQRIKELGEKTGVLKEIRGRPSILDILKELTQVMPETAWVTDLSFSDKGIQVNGFAQSASELISLLESSPLFEDVVFLSAIVKDPKENRERFNIKLKPVNPNQSGKASDSTQ